MGGKQPSTIFTDQDAAMAGAIAYVLPNTSHQLCLCHIYPNASKHLSHVIHMHPQKFQSNFICSLSVANGNIPCIEVFSDKTSS
jgi:hypothetical protein